MSAAANRFGEYDFLDPELDDPRIFTLEEQKN
jgi:hypothetical protein